MHAIQKKGLTAIAHLFVRRMARQCHSPLSPSSRCRAVVVWASCTLLCRFAPPHLSCLFAFPFSVVLGLTFIFLRPSTCLAMCSLFLFYFNKYSPIWCFIIFSHVTPNFLNFWEKTLLTYSYTHCTLLLVVAPSTPLTVLKSTGIKRTIHPHWNEGSNHATTLFPHCFFFAHTLYMRRKMYQKIDTTPHFPQHTPHRTRRIFLSQLQYWLFFVVFTTSRLSVCTFQQAHYRFEILA